MEQPDYGQTPVVTMNSDDQSQDNSGQSLVPVVLEELLLDLDDDLEGTQEKDLSESLTLLRELRVRCDNTKIAYVSSPDPDDPWMRIKIPAGRETRDVHIGNLVRARDMIAQKFELVSYLADYEAICNYEERYIVAALGTLNIAANLKMRRLFGIERFQDVRDGKDHTLIVESPKHHPELRVFLSFHSDRLSPFVSRSGGSGNPLLTIEI